MRFFACPIARIHDLNGDLVLDLSDANGYGASSLAGTAGTTYRDNLTEGPYVEGSAEVTPAVRSSLRRVEKVVVLGTPGLTGDAYWRSVEDRIVALEAAVAQQFLYTVSLGGYLWTYRSVGPANTEASDFDHRRAYALGQRDVLMSFTVQPNPTKVAP